MTTHSKSPVSFFFNKKISISKQSGLKNFIIKVFKMEKRAVENVNFIFCSDKELLRINREYLDHDFYTDIITFELSPKGEPVVADIYISVDRVRENAKNLSVSLKSEIHRVIFHGILHLCGFKDKSAADQKMMRAKEAELLKSYGI